MLLHSLARPAGSLVRMIGRLRRCNRGVAAVEFGMIVPIMFMLFVGAVEFSQAITVDRRVTQVASSTADLVARQTAVTQSQLDGYMQIISQLLKPYSSTPLKLSLLNVYVPAGGAATNTLICWAYPYQGGTGTYTKGGSYAVPTGILTAGTSVIVAEVQYDYAPLLFRYFITSTMPMNEKFFLKPRLSASIQYNSDALCL